MKQVLLFFLFCIFSIGADFAQKDSITYVNSLAPRSFSVLNMNVVDSGSIKIFYALNATDNLLYGFDYNGIMQVKTTIDQPTQSENYGLNFTGSKGYHFWQTTFNLSGGYNESRGEQLLQNEILTYRSEGYNAGASINTTPSGLINLTYSFGWSQSRSFSEDLSTRFPPIRSQNHTASIWLNPNRHFGINLSGDYRYNSAVNNRNTTFFDARLRYKNKQTEWELACNNLFNVRQYVSASYTDLSTYYYRYNLRSRSYLLSVRFKLK